MGSQKSCNRDLQYHLLLEKPKYKVIIQYMLLTNSSLFFLQFFLKFIISNK